MLNFVVCLYAHKHIIVYDENQYPINSTENFKTWNDRLMHDRIINFGESDAHQEEFLNIIDTIFKLINYRREVQNTNISVEDVKYLFANYVTTRVRTGGFQLELLELASGFDDKLVSHWNILYQYNIDQIRESIKKPLELYDKTVCTIAMSFHYVHMAFLMLMYELYLFQARQNKVNRHANFYVRHYFKFANLAQPIQSYRSSTKFKAQLSITILCLLLFLTVILRRLKQKTANTYANQNHFVYISCFPNSRF